MTAKQCVDLVLSPVYITYTQVIKLFIMTCGDNEYLIMFIVLWKPRSLSHLYYRIYVSYL